MKLLRVVSGVELLEIAVAEYEKSEWQVPHISR